MIEKILLLLLLSLIAVISFVIGVLLMPISRVWLSSHDTFTAISGFGLWALALAMCSVVPVVLSFTIYFVATFDGKPYTDEPKIQYEDPLAQAIQERYGEVNTDVLIKTELYMAQMNYEADSFADTIPAALKIYHQLLARTNKINTL